MKAITLWQPWASLIAIGAKRIETRSWSTRYRGPLLIHAALTKSEEWFFTTGKCDTLRLHGYARFGQLPFGKLVAVCTLEDCIRTTDVRNLSDEEKAFGDYSPGRYAWRLGDVRRIDSPIPAIGGRMFWNWDGSLIACPQCLSLFEQGSACGGCSNGALNDKMSH